MIIGGIGFDESKFGRRKYNRGHRVDSAWALCGIERAAEEKVFFVTVLTESMKH